MPLDQLLAQYGYVIGEDGRKRSAGDAHSVEDNGSPSNGKALSWVGLAITILLENYPFPRLYVWRTSHHHALQHSRLTNMHHHRPCGKAGPDWRGGADLDLRSRHERCAAVKPSSQRRQRSCTAPS